MPVAVKEVKQGMYKEYTVDVQDDSKVTHFYRSDKLPFN
jgi:hypothetical protein